MGHMKRMILKIVTGVLLMLPATLSAQTILLTAENTFPGYTKTVINNKNYDLSYCWEMSSGITYTKNPKITGTYSVNAPVSSSSVKTPWMKPLSGNITLNARLSANTTGTRKIDFYYIPYSASGASFEGTAQKFYTYSWTALNTTVKAISVAIPSAIANSLTPHRIMLVFVGTGGTGTIIFDNFSIPGSYASDVSDCAGSPVLTDVDNDGVLDVEDAFPNDAAKAYIHYFPATGRGMYLYEDLWPYMGDYDMNDLVLTYRHTVITSASDKVVSLQSDYTIKAVGASRHSGFAFQLDNIAPSKISSVTGVDPSNPSWWTKTSNGTESGATFANILVFDDGLRVMPHPFERYTTNTFLADDYITPVSYSVVVNFVANQVALSELAINPYLMAEQVRSREIHLPGKRPTSKADATLFGIGVDATSSSSGKYYKSVTNLPWAMDIIEEIPYMQEEFDFIKGYLQFVPWAQSNGTLYTDWYKDLPGYRDNSKLYIR